MTGQQLLIPFAGIGGEEVAKDQVILTCKTSKANVSTKVLSKTYSWDKHPDSKDHELGSSKENHAKDTQNLLWKGSSKYIYYKHKHKVKDTWATTH